MDMEKVQQVFEKEIISLGLSKEQALDMVDKAFANIKSRRDKLLLVNRELKVVPDMEQAAAVVMLVKEEDITDKDDISDLKLSDYLVNIAFLEPIGHDASLDESLAMHKQWQSKNYPQYHSTLISLLFYRTAQRCGLTSFKDCWSRSMCNEGYPQYRAYTMPASPLDVECDKKLPNVYASLVMTKEEFEKINPDMDRAKYYSGI